MFALRDQGSEELEEGRYYLVESLGVPALMLWQEGEWHDPHAGFSDDLVLENLQVEALLEEL